MRHNITVAPNKNRQKLEVSKNTKLDDPIKEPSEALYEFKKELSELSNILKRTSYCPKYLDSLRDVIFAGTQQ